MNNGYYSLNPDISSHFIQSATLLIEQLYPSINMVIEIETSSCRLAGQLMCTYLMKMLFAFYNVEPILDEQIQIGIGSDTGKLFRRKNNTIIIS